jgi:hypothetical protein
VRTEPKNRRAEATARTTSGPDARSSNASLNWRNRLYVIRRAMITHEESIRISTPPIRPSRHAFPNTGP